MSAHYDDEYLRDDSFKENGRSREISPPALLNFRKSKLTAALGLALSSKPSELEMGLYEAFFASEDISDAIRVAEKVLGIWKAGLIIVGAYDAGALPCSVEFDHYVVMAFSTGALVGRYINIGDNKQLVEIKLPEDSMRLGAFIAVNVPNRRNELLMGNEDDGTSGLPIIRCLQESSFSRGIMELTDLVLMLRSRATYLIRWWGAPLKYN